MSSYTYTHFPIVLALSLRVSKSSNSPIALSLPTAHILASICHFLLQERLLGEVTDSKPRTEKV